ncbi:hypothetical protein M409DRAFT_28463 [Zasmidium cellare ATCC 36951]|uniref:Amidohydrolase-related domain-containing protein n=1 Tax=Zasmidium cellare ATCC 36951 TaxID=1080233 RepID=A0A6A6C2H3_ZASCE|nr:uncharacterized protein M409DRAFT_28463 [Zasmidium cellare ATCC 36951]KAF2161133.1 hypothetical protein M409DRAFT_28463 [Zasmidium cellare ATCC 36951]
MALSSILPKGSWDSHLHIIDTTRFFQTPDSGNSTPVVAGVWENVAFESSINCTNVVIVQPTRYGLDNSAALQALTAYGPKRARAVVQFDPDTITPYQLQTWHDLGVRGVRLNFANNNNPTSNTPPEKMPQLLQRYADLIRPYGWAIQMVIYMEKLAPLTTVIPTLGVKVVIDHFAHSRLPDNASSAGEVDPYSITGFDTLVQLLEEGNTWVKISAPYRLTTDDDPEHKSLDPLIRELLRIDSTKAVFGTDWPHTDYEGIDIRPWVKHLADLTSENKTVQQRVFQDNARTLYDAY